MVSGRKLEVGSCVSMALARKHSLNKKDINLLFRQGKTVKSSFFFIRFLKNNQNHLRVAVILSAKLFKKATMRNRLKRKILEIIRSGHFLENSYDIAIVVTANILGKQSKESNRELEQTIIKIFSQS